MVDRVEFQGPRGQVGYGLDAAQVSLSGDDQCVYVERVKGVLQVWSGPMCRACVRSGRALRRCQLHKSVLIVAQQLRLTGDDLTI